MRATISTISGWLVVIPLAISMSKKVLPALGGATSIALCPLPMGAIRSIKRVEITSLVVSSFIQSFGKIGVSSVKCGLFRALSGSIPSTDSILSNERYLSPSLGGLA